LYPSLASYCGEANASPLSKPVFSATIEHCPATEPLPPYLDYDLKVMAQKAKNGI